MLISLIRSKINLWLILYRSLLLFGSFTLVIVLNFLKSKAFSKRPFYLEFQGLTYCSIFDFQGPSLSLSGKLTQKEGFEPSRRY